MSNTFIPKTREEAYAAKISGVYEGTMPAPQTNEEKYLAAMSKSYTGELPTPRSRKQMLMKKAAECDNSNTAWRDDGDHVFKPNTLSKIIFPPNFIKIDNGCLTNLPLEEVVLNNISEIGRGALSNTRLTDLELPEPIKILNSGAFAACERLTCVKFFGTPAEIDAEAFALCAALTDIYVPWSEGEVANAPWGATNATIHL